VPRLAFFGRRQITGKHGEPRRVEKDLRLLADGDDVGALRNCPERVDVVALVPEHRLVPA
jgi:hypothetical protein